MWSFADYVIAILFQFVSRTVILHVLGVAYLGLSSLFSSILQVLNMTEMGFSSAVIYNLYQPIANHDDEKVCALLAFYRKIYRIVGCVILGVGLVISPFLRSLIKDEVPADINLYILYFLYLANTAVSYFVFAYKAALLNALQRMDLTKISYSIVHLAQCVFQLLAVLIFKNYYLFVVGTIIGTAFKNLLAAWFARKHYPQFRSRGNITDETKKDIWQRVKGLLIGKISGVTYTTFDSIILSAMIGWTAVAIYNNYFTIYTAIASVIIMIRQAMQASVGNSVASETVEKNYRDVFKWQFLFSAIAIWCSACLMCLYQPFMTLWMGEEMLLSIIDVVILSALLAVSTVQHAFYLYLSGYGLWWNLRWPNILSTVTNLVLNIVLCRLWGITGIILATLFAQFVFGLIWQCGIVFQTYFQTSPFAYYKKQFLYFTVGIGVCGVCYGICSAIPMDGVGGLILKGLVCAAVPPLLLLIAFMKTEAFAECRQILRYILKK